MFYFIDLISGADSLTDVLNAFFTSTRIRGKLVDLEGNTVQMPSEYGYTPFCSIVRKDEESRNNCRASCLKASLGCSETCRPYIFKCHMGLTGWAIPVMVRNQHQYTIICSQVLAGKPGKNFYRYLKRSANRIDADHTLLLKEAEKMNIVPIRQMQSDVETLFIIANYFAKYEAENLISRPIEEKVINGTEDSIEKTIEKEIDEMMECMKLKQTSAIVQNLNMLYERLIKDSSSAPRFLSTFSVRLVAAASQEKVDSETLANIHGKFLQSLLSPEEADDLYQALKRFVLEIYYNLPVNLLKGNTLVVNAAKTYLKDNFYRNDLHSEDIADHALVSTSYLRHIFKEQTGQTLNQHLTHLRIDKASSLLRNTDTAVSEISEQCGFSSQAYFTRAFSKKVGKTPSEYRKMYE